MDEIRTTDSPALSGLRGRCPRCGEGHLFAGYLGFRPACEVCGLDFKFIDSADGPAFFVMSIVGIVVVGLAMWVEFTYEPPMWVHAALWGPLAIVLSLVLVRPLKGMMAALQYTNKAAEGRFR
ncbi:hypothetical protein OPKNFCMD_3387 [Methylobacterium crusticola]|uniref:DUF983 domain-containing protein n=1 Tax=Methylobacterium crusticola TaxID=1697972 RepID=A0ABQ4R1A1_9HYPH|nr:DUF983 domain-containing protein [Methylobacterium crusticola]GJD50644.1 hypothetical protein OPKNFCMD_3387 [Methylobacterium crusticola]